MSSRLDNIARRKQALIEKAALERLELTTACRRIRSPIDIDSREFRWIRLIKHNKVATSANADGHIAANRPTVFDLSNIQAAIK